MDETFIGEALTPVAGSFDATGTSRGEPALPGKFLWRGREYAVAEVLDKSKGYGPCPSGEIYLRKHRYTVRTADGTVMRIYFERHGRTPRSRTRWWLQAVLQTGGSR
jgi:hypothetical protein